MYSKSAIAATESLIHEKVEYLGHKLRQSLSNGQVLGLRTLYLALATDVVTGHHFAKPSRFLADDRAAADWKATCTEVAASTPFIKQFTWIFPLALSLPQALIQLLTPDLADIIAFRNVSISIA